MSWTLRSRPGFPPTDDGLRLLVVYDYRAVVSRFGLFIMDRPTFLLFHDVVYGGEDGFLPAPVVFTTFLPILVYDFS